MQRHPDDHDLSLSAVMDQYGHLNEVGNYDKEWFQTDGEVDEDEFNASRERLRAATDAFEEAKAWIRTVLTSRTKHVNKKTTSSYGLKHIAEKECKSGFVSNGTFIAAMIACGFLCDDDPSPHFNLSKKCDDDANQRWNMILKQK